MVLSVALGFTVHRLCLWRIEGEGEGEGEGERYYDIQQSCSGEVPY